MYFKHNMDCGLGLQTQTADSDCGLRLRTRIANSDCKFGLRTRTADSDYGLRIAEKSKYGVDNFILTKSHYRFLFF